MRLISSFVLYQEPSIPPKIPSSTPLSLLDFDLFGQTKQRHYHPRRILVLASSSSRNHRSPPKTSSLTRLSLLHCGLSGQTKQRHHHPTQKLDKNFSQLVPTPLHLRPLSIEPQARMHHLGPCASTSQGHSLRIHSSKSAILQYWDCGFLG